MEVIEEFLGSIVDEKRWKGYLHWTSRTPGVNKIKDSQNPTIWMLDVTSSTVEAQVGVDFAEIYANSDLYKRNQQLITELSKPSLSSQDLYFSTKGQQQDVMHLMGAMYAAVMFLGGTNTSAVQTVVSVERAVFYREKAAGMYSAIPYAFAQVTIGVVYVGIQTLIYSLLIYSMIGFHWSAANFFLFYFYIFMCFAYFTLCEMMLIALTPNYEIAAVTMAFYLNMQVDNEM
ncbi:putative ABC-2 type transporter [Helianthus anomalus]